MNKLVTFCGFGPTTWCTPPSGEIWSLNNYYDHMDFIPDRIYQIHAQKDLTEKDYNIEKYGDILTIVTESYGFKNERFFDLRSALISFKEQMFTSSLCYMFNDAIKEGFTEIKLYGICLLVEEEWTRQVVAVLKWIDIARSKGIIVESPYEAVWRVCNFKCLGEFYGSAKALEEAKSNG